MWCIIRQNCNYFFSKGWDWNIRRFQLPAFPFKNQPFMWIHSTLNSNFLYLPFNSGWYPMKFKSHGKCYTNHFCLVIFIVSCTKMSNSCSSLTHLLYFVKYLVFYPTLQKGSKLKIDFSKGGDEKIDYTLQF